MRTHGFILIWWKINISKRMTIHIPGFVLTHFESWMDAEFYASGPCLWLCTGNDQGCGGKFFFFFGGTWAWMTWPGDSHATGQYSTTMWRWEITTISLPQQHHSYTHTVHAVEMCVTSGESGEMNKMNYRRKSSYRGCSFRRCCDAGHGFSAQTHVL